jgi:hypothetical protein
MANNLTTFMNPFSRNSVSLNLLETLGPVQACNGFTVPLPYNRYVSFSEQVSTVPHVMSISTVMRSLLLVLYATTVSETQTARIVKV